jgi:hypothetical protein
VSEADEVLVGVEEEFLLVDVETRRPAPRIAGVIGDAVALAGDQAQEELHKAQIELATSPHLTLPELRDDLVSLRQKMVEAAGNHGCAIVASATYADAMGESGRLITERTVTKPWLSPTRCWPENSSSAAVTCTSPCPIPTNPSES